MRITLQPERWDPQPPDDSLHAVRHELAALVNENADRLGTGSLNDPAAPLIMSGHQAARWHPGILAKDLAAHAVARRVGGAAVHLVVDGDEHPTGYDRPIVQGDRLIAQPVESGANQGVPTGMQPAVGPSEGPATLAEQITLENEAVRSQLIGPMPVVFCSQLATLPAFASLVQQIAVEPRQCVEAYNAAIQKHPDANLRPLNLTRERVELPLWACRWEQPRARVYLDDSENELVINRGEKLLPRALLMTGFAREFFCDTFVHGTGGAVYDLATEAWWRGWRERRVLSPQVMATADVRLEFDVPVAEPAELHRAVWYRHHLPHNIDRYAEVDAEKLREKQDLLRTLAGKSAGRGAKRDAFRRLHELNRAMVNEHRGLLEVADRRLAAARAGVANYTTARRRDWWIGCYPTEQLEALNREIEAAFGLANPLHAKPQAAVQNKI